MKKILLVILSCICYTNFIYGQHPPNKLGFEIKGFNTEGDMLEDYFNFIFFSICDIIEDDNKSNRRPNYNSDEIHKIEKDNDYLYLSIQLSDFSGSASLIKSAPIVDDKKVIVLQIINNTKVMNVFLGFKELMLEGRTAYINNFKFKKGNFFIDIIDNQTSIIEDAVIDFSKSKKLSKAKTKEFIETNCQSIKKMTQ